MEKRSDDEGVSGSDPDPDGSDGNGALHVATEGEDWRFSLEDLEGDDEPEGLTPGSPSLENTAFVLLGVAVTGLVILQLVL